MAKNPNNRPRAAKQDDPMNAAMKFFLAGCVAELYLLIIRRFYVYGTLEQVVAWDDYLKYFAWAGLAVLVVGAVLSSLWRADRSRQQIGWALAGLGAFVGAVSAVVRLNMSVLTLLYVVVPAVMLLGIVYHAAEAYFTPVVVPDVNTTQDAAMQFAQGLPAYLEEVSIALLPIIGMFVLYQLISRRFRGKALGRVIIGVLYTYAGLVLFLTGVNVGFMPVGYFIGGEVAASNLKWLLIPIGMLIGYFIVTAEPAVHVLNKQVEEISAGAISAKSMNLSLSLGVAVSVGIAMLRVLMGIPIYYFLVPGYAIALVLGFFVPNMFTAIAFDSGGVASGPMTATFLLPFAMGACEAVGGDILMDAFGVVAMVAMTPLITIQIMGFVSKRRMRAAERVLLIDVDALADRFVYYDEDEEGSGA